MYAGTDRDVDLREFAWTIGLFHVEVKKHLCRPDTENIVVAIQPLQNSG